MLLCFKPLKIRLKVYVVYVIFSGDLNQNLYKFHVLHQNPTYIHT